MGVMEGHDDETYCLQLVIFIDLISFPATLTRFSDTLTRSLNKDDQPWWTPIEKKSNMENRIYTLIRKKV